MAIPQVNITVKNGGLGIASANSEGIQAKVGRITEEEFRDALKTAIAEENRIPVNTPRTYNDAQKIIAECGSGDLAQAAILALQQGGPVVVCRVADATMEGEGAADCAVTYKAALEALANSGLTYELAHCVGFIPDGQIAAFVAMLDTQSQVLWKAKKYDSAFFACEVDAEAADRAQEALKDAKSDHVCVCLGRVTAANPISGSARSDMPLGWPAMARASAVGIGIDLARVADGPLDGVTDVAPNEQVEGGAYDAAGFTTGRTFPRKKGIYLTNGRMLSVEGSDIKYVQHRRIMNAACAAAYDNLINLIGREVPVDMETGGIEEGAAASIEANCLRAVLDRVGNAVTSASVAVDRTTNLLSTEEILVSISLVPFGYLKRIEATIGFKNPALASA